MVTIDCNDFLKFLTSSDEVPLPKDNVGKRKLLNKLFHDSCMVFRDSKGNYFVGELNWTNCTGYSMTVDGKEKQFPYSDLKRLFKPMLC